MYLDNFSYYNWQIKGFNIQRLNYGSKVEYKLLGDKRPKGLEPPQGLETKYIKFRRESFHQIIGLFFKF